MPDARLESTTIYVGTENKKSIKRYSFRALGSVIKFPGYRAVYMEGSDDSTKDDNEESLPMPKLSDGDPLDCLGLESEQKFTQPPPRFTEATVIKTLEEEGIGRPSTYAPTIATIMERDYVRKEGGCFVPTKLGSAVSGLLTTHFPDIMDVGFTAKVEEELDEIAKGEREWMPVLRDFYGPFDEAIEKAMKEAERVPRDQIDEETDEVCEKCERSMVIKSGRFGRFLSCSGFPECRNSRPYLARMGVECPECGGDLVERNQKRKGGRKFYGCSNYPTCNFAVNQRPLQQPCPECGKLLLASGRSNSSCTSCGYKGPAPERETVDMAT